jgi:hypothetical protein
MSSSPPSLRQRVEWANQLRQNDGCGLRFGGRYNLPFMPREIWKKIFGINDEREEQDREARVAPLLDFWRKMLEELEDEFQTYLYGIEGGYNTPRYGSPSTSLRGLTSNENLDEMRNAISGFDHTIKSWFLGQEQRRFLNMYRDSL